MYKKLFSILLLESYYLYGWGKNYLLKPSAWGNKNLLTAEEGEKKGLK